jgi:hypothetical protein
MTTRVGVVVRNNREAEEKMAALLAHWRARLAGLSCQHASTSQLQRIARASPFAMVLKEQGSPAPPRRRIVMSVKTYLLSFATGPNEQDVITVILDGFSSTRRLSLDLGQRKRGRTNLTILGFARGPPPFPTRIFASFGPLPQGTYTYRVYQVFEGQTILVSQQTFVVAPPIPTMSGLFLSVLAVFIAAIGCFTLGKHT